MEGGEGNDLIVSLSIDEQVSVRQSEGVEGTCEQLGEDD